MTGLESRSAKYGNVNQAARIGVVCHKDSWGRLVKEYCVRAGWTNVTLLYKNVSKPIEPLDFDLIFLDDSYFSDLTGGELLDSLLINQKLKVTTAVIMVGESVEATIHNYDSMTLLLKFLPRSFSEKLFNQTVSQSLLAQQVFFPALNYINQGKLAFAYKSMGFWDKQQIPKELLLEFCKLYVNLAFELGNYQQVLSICNKPQFKNMDWTLWPRFKANYELGNWAYCEQSIHQEPFTALPSGSMKLFWQLRLMLEKERYQDAIELIEDLPQQQMSLSMIRLVFSLMAVSGNWQKAEEFIVRKVRLAQNEPMAQATLINAQCSIYLYEFYATDDAELQQTALTRLKLHLADFAKHKKAMSFKVNREVFDIYLQIVSLTEQDESTELKNNLVEQLLSLQQEITSPVLLCRVAYAWHLLGNKEACFEVLVKADIAFSYTPLGCERLLLAMMHKQILFNIYPHEERLFMYQSLGLSHQKEQRFKLACKAFSRALDIEPQNKEVRQLLARNMKDADMTSFAGYQIQDDNLL